MTQDEQQRHDADQAAKERAIENRDDRIAKRDFGKLTPEQQQDEMLQRKIDAAVDAKIARMVLQSGAGIKVTGGNGNWTIEFDPSAVTMTGDGACNDDGTSTFTFKLTV